MGFSVSIVGRSLHAGEDICEDSSGNLWLITQPEWEKQGKWTAGEKRIT